MNKYKLSIVGIIVQCIGIGLMLTNINSENYIYLWIGFVLIFLGLSIILIGLFLNREKE